MQIDLARHGLRAQIELHLRRVGFEPGQFQPGTGFGQSRLGFGHIGLGQGQRRGEPRRVDPKQHLARRDHAAVAEIARHFHQRPGHGSAQLQGAAAGKVPIGGDRRGDRFGGERGDAHGIGPLARRARLRPGPGAILVGAVEHAARGKQQGDGSAADGQSEPGTGERRHVRGLRLRFDLFAAPKDHSKRNPVKRCAVVGVVSRWRCTGARSAAPWRAPASWRGGR